MDLRARLAAPLAVAIAGTVLAAGAAQATTVPARPASVLPGASSVFPTGEFKLRNGVCLSYQPGEPLDGGGCWDKEVIVWKYKADTQQLIARNGLCMGEWDSAPGVAVLETCDDSAADQKWGSYKGNDGYTVIYPAADAATAKNVLEWEFGLPGGPPINDSKIIRRLYMYKLDSGAWFVSIRETDRSVDFNPTIQDRTGFTVLGV